MVLCRPHDVGQDDGDDGMVTSTFRTFATVQPASSVNVIVYVLSSIPVMQMVSDLVRMSA
ncbi:MAG: hypothetical protein IPJ13_06555 [Saprospiraceae bacterium]|nr:hypothetical protein [Saprospiraceae bacterium]